MMIGAKQKEESSNGGLHNTLTIGTTVKGTIHTDGDLRLDGNVEGDIVCSGKIVVGPKGIIKGNVQSGNAEIHGSIEGKLEIKEKLVLKASAIVKGDIFLKTFEVEPGAKLTGKVCSNE